MPKTNGMNGKFELPKLGPLDSLTAGTDIPPPLESPTQEKPAIEVKPVKPGNVSAAAEGAPPAVSTKSPSQAPAAVNGTSTTAYPESATPTSPVRPNSVRRLFNRRSVYGDGNFTASAGNLSRPDSSNSSIASSRPGLSKKRNSSWFRRFMSSGQESKENKRSSVVYEDAQEQPPAKRVDHGPPPPMLPELSQLKSRVEGDSLGGEELFKNIH